jgi:hypothetical protein
VIEMVRERFPDTEARRDFVFNCEACQEIQQNPQLRERVAVLLHELASKAKATAGDELSSDQGAYR